MEYYEKRGCSYQQFKNEADLIRCAGSHGLSLFVMVAPFFEQRGYLRAHEHRVLLLSSLLYVDLFVNSFFSLFPDANRATKLTTRGSWYRSLAISRACRSGRDDDLLLLLHGINPQQEFDVTCRRSLPLPPLKYSSLAQRPLRTTLTSFEMPSTAAPHFASSVSHAFE